MITSDDFAHARDFSGSGGNIFDAFTRDKHINISAHSRGRCDGFVSCVFEFRIIVFCNNKNSH